VIEQAFNPTVRRLQALRMPTMAAVNGVAAGAGASLAMTCDIAIAAPGASFIQAFSKIGLMPDAGGTWFLRSGWAGARHGAGHDGRQAAGRPGQGVGPDLGRGRRLPRGRRHGPGPAPGRHAHQGPGGHPRPPARRRHQRTLDQQLDVERDTQSAMGARTTTSKA
jgi:2-(1,2-epoxy-1,2-dihydrophenyl)acetyl-CoA isomerase